MPLDTQIISQDIDLSSYFNSINGTAIFLTSDNKEYIYNNDLVDIRFSPYSTFKIVSTLIGLNEEIITSKNSTMQYDGSTYWYDLWNDNLNLEQAFKHSCVWYYHQIIYQIPRDTIQLQLNSLNYGNMDLTEWDGNGNNPKEDLNGFWLNSSLEISPREQVVLLKNIFENNSIYSDENVELLGQLMDIGEYSVHAKTGSGGNESWYVGYFDFNDDTIYFATFITGDDVSGALAKEISLSLIDDWDLIMK